ncbi:MAG: hypothetical protein J2P26_06490 [Nocardiopsaceae bacterium]|nr:hypothetical protein [Nocardiopsaceae bacterium]
MTPREQELAALAKKHPAWQVWVVECYLGGPVWCARPWGRTRPVLNAGGPVHLDEDISGREPACDSRESAGCVLADGDDVITPGPDCWPSRT